MAMNKYLSIRTLNINGLSAPIKRHRKAGWIRKHNPHMCCPQETQLRTKDLHRLKVKCWRKIYMQMGRKKCGCSNIYIKQNRLQNKSQNKRHRRALHNTKWNNPSKRDKHCKHTCTNIGVPKYINKILKDFKKHIDSNTYILGNFKTPLSKMDRSSKQNINKRPNGLN
ncbi:hypothetical protein HJG60_011463 [Phyllostomus discolor]|uniref:Uncharacterized protein n=1 Tax=Phyllostomus discolor TaxID=89673 RepID=A0A834E336_9CHIR|nr:hypothetical protein HJG60_011463 [Phyllostomus discolor]